MKVKNESEVAQSYPTLSDPIDCSSPGSSIHGIFQARRVLEWGVIDFSNYLFSSSLITISWNHWTSFCSYPLFPTVLFLRKRQTFSYVTEICQSISCWFFLERWQTFRKVKAKYSSFLVAFLTSKPPEVKSLEVITPGFTTRKLKRNDFSWLSKKKLVLLGKLLL